MSSHTPAPTGLLCQLMAHPERTLITAAYPRLGWIVPDDGIHKHQRAYQIQVASRRDLLDSDRPDLWDSGRVISRRSLDVRYQGAPLPSHADMYWRVRIWQDDESPST